MGLHPECLRDPKLQKGGCSLAAQVAVFMATQDLIECILSPEKGANASLRRGRRPSPQRRGRVQSNKGILEAVPNFGFAARKVDLN